MEILISFYTRMASWLTELSRASPVGGRGGETNLGQGQRCNCSIVLHYEALFIEASSRMVGFLLLCAMVRKA